MPSYDGGLGVFVRKGKVQIEEWLLLLERRRELIRPHLDSITLPEIGHLMCLRNEAFLHDLRLDEPKIVATGSEDLSLKTQGIFRVQPLYKKETFPATRFQTAPILNRPDGIVRAWGLTRKAKWVLVTVHFSGQPGWNQRGYEKAELVEIKETDLVAIIEATKQRPKSMWFELGKAFKEIVEQRRHLLNELIPAETTVEMEERAFSLMERGQ